MVGALTCLRSRKGTWGWVPERGLCGNAETRTVCDLEPVGHVQAVRVDLREKVLDVAGQEMMTADKVTLRMNAVVTYRVVDARKTVEDVVDADQALYREAQLALRAEIGTRDLDDLLGDKDAVGGALEKTLRVRAQSFGIRVIGLGIRDLILPGDMKELLNQVIEARKRAEANMIQRREETAAMRSQANTARLLTDNPTLMRLRELEVLQSIAGSARLNVLVGEKGAHRAGNQPAVSKEEAHASSFLYATWAHDWIKTQWAHPRL